jgi:hypothetical protein
MPRNLKPARSWSALFCCRESGEIYRWSNGHTSESAAREAASRLARVFEINLDRNGDSLLIVRPVD